jgi:hypothetical protein
MSDTTYFNGFNRIKKSNYGIKISGHIDKIIEELKKHTNGRGYVNLELKERKSPDPKSGNTHYIVLDTWEPAERKEETPVKPAKEQWSGGEDSPF